MPEIKHSFQGGKMNKDLDERLVPNGQYRDAMNIQVRTTDTGDAGTAQNLLGNTAMQKIYNTYGVTSDSSKVVGCVTDEKSDNIYFMVAAPDASNIGIKSATITGETKYIDYIIEHNAITGVQMPVIVDHWATINLTSNVLSLDSTNNADGWVLVSVIQAAWDSMRVGMYLEAWDQNGDLIIDGTIIKKYSTENSLLTVPKIELDKPNPFANQWTAEDTSTDPDTPEQNGIKYIRLTNERVLEFPRDRKITGINIIDDLLYWTDGVNEPKRVNITHGKAGSNLAKNASTDALLVGENLTTHTKLYAEDPSSLTNTLVPITTLEPPVAINNNGWIKKEHVTVIRKAPISPPLLEMQETDRGEGQANVIIQTPNDYQFVSADSNSPIFVDDFKVGDFRLIDNPEFENTVFRTDDIIVIKDLNPYGGEANEDPVMLKAKFVAYIDDNGDDSIAATSKIKLSMLFIHEDLVPSITEWELSLQQKKPLFELKLARFAYRYKYENDEYSTFSPWSELAFLPGRYQYKSYEAHNLGMVNRTRHLTIKNFIPFSGHRPLDVKSVDILYKEVNKSNVYIVKTVNRGVDPEWLGFTPQSSSSVVTLEQIQNSNIWSSTEGKPSNGELTITSEMIHKTLESNQVLRVWDNVPRSAQAQEITGNRLVYGNYKQGYNIPLPISLKQELRSYEIDKTQPPKKSVKSLRNYKWGMVFGDKYGRETPVITSTFTTGNQDKYTSVTGDLSVDKDLSITQNKFTLTQDWSSPFITGGEPPDYFDYVKYYVKETSNEYYNLVLDRWYYADDTDQKENNKSLWLSFPSADRNKVDEETYLILKKKHGSDEAVLDKARYKIIAIENEAPDFIKIDHRKVGVCELVPYANNLGTNGSLWTSTALSTMETASPVQLFEKDYFLLGIQAFDELFNTGNDVGQNIYKPFKREGKMRGRIVGICDDAVNGFYGVIKSRWNTISNIKWYNLSNNGHHTFYFRDKWTADEVDMRQRFLDMGFEDPAVAGKVNDLTYKFEFKEEVYENKPEFDGRFFVKVQSDSVIENDVLVSANTTTNYYRTHTSSIGYIDSSTDNQGLDSTGAYYGDVSDDDSPLWWQGAFQDTDELPSWASDYTDGYQSYGAHNFTPWKNNNGDNNPSAWIDADGSEDGLAENPYRTVDDTQGDNSDNPYEDDIIPWVPSNVAEGFATAAWRNSTRQFWIDYQCKGSRWFIDAARVRRMNIGSKSYDNTKPSGLDEGVIDPSTAFTNGVTLTAAPASGHLGRLSFGINKKSVSEMDSGAQDFYNQMRTLGQIFRFPDETDTTTGERIYYKVIALEDYSNERNYPKVNGFFDDQGEQTLNDHGFWPTSENENYSRRSGFRINFRRIDTGTGLPLASNAALDPANYDPRSHMRHDGETTIDIELYQRVISGGDGLVVAGGDGASWETEPKEDVNLDLYYEASTALPMQLTADNVYNYIPIGCEIEVTRNSGQGEVKVDLAYDTLSEHHVANIVMRPAWDIAAPDFESALESYALAPIILIRAVNQTGGWADHDRDIAIGDFISFKHPNGLITKSRITNNFSRSQLPFFSPAIQEQFNIDVPFWEPSTPNQSLNNYITWSFAQGISYQYLLGMSVLAPIGNQEYEVGMIIQAEDQTIGFPTCAIISFPNWANLVITDQTYNLLQWFTNTDNWPTDDNGAYLYNATVDDNGDPLNYPDIPIVITEQTGWFAIDPFVWKYPVTLPWHNCWTFGNGVESDRIRDDFNAPQLDNGVMVSTTSQDYREESVTSGLIHSGIYNPSSSTNKLSEFNMAEKITKNLNPSYGSVQALKSRFDSLITFTEDKVLKVLSSKDALYNADGNSQLVATNRVLGNVTPYVGDYGISKDPASLASDQYRMYFTDKQRGAVLRLSRDGLTPISEVGMKTWFRNQLATVDDILGTFDVVTGEYNLTLEYNSATNYTVSFNEASKGWTSFKSFIPKAGASVSGKYFTAIDGAASAGASGLDSADPPMPKADMIYKHHDNASCNNFYGTASNSTVTVLMNDMPGSIKSFRSVNYEGSQSAITALPTSSPANVLGQTLTNIDDGEFYNLSTGTGWSVTLANTDKDQGIIPEFIEKEGKWFNSIRGQEYATIWNTDTEDVNDGWIQGLGTPTLVSDTYS